MTTSRGYLGILYILTAIITSDSSQAGKGYCSFPPFLWMSNDGVERNRKWLSNTEFPEQSNTWIKQKNISVAETEITIHHHISVACAGNKDRKSSHCYWQVLQYKIICIQEEQDGKFRVQREYNGQYQFSCLKFEERAPGVVQLYSATPKELNEARLCFNTALHRQEWPWIDPLVVTWSPCPLSGGFDFRPSFLSAATMDGCSDTWLPARMESECILGEGIHFTFPDGTCNPFNSSTTDYRLQCRAVWTEGVFTFYLLSDDHNTPRYMLRLPADAEDMSSFNTQLYLSAVAPVSSMGRPPGDVMAFTMYLTRTAPGSCYDESDSCEKYAADGKCTNTGFHEVASHCVKSCGRCDMAARNTSECFFSEELDGQWHLFDEQGHDTWVVTPPVIYTDRLGTFYCKSKHWNRDYYKTLSIYKNGCRPRYSCLELYRSQPQLLKFRLSQSSLTDDSFSLCTFRDDPLPVGDNIRSEDRKVLLASSVVSFGGCGLGLAAHVNVSTGPTSSCDGYMTDINKDTCTWSQHLTLSLHNCPHMPEIEFYCVARGTLASGTRLLVMQKTNSHLHQCFLVEISSDAFDVPIFHFESTRCSTQTSLPSVHTGITSITSFTDIVEHPCITKMLQSHAYLNGRLPTHSPTDLVLSNPETADRQNQHSTTPRHGSHSKRKTESGRDYSNQVSGAEQAISTASVMCTATVLYSVMMALLS